MGTRIENDEHLDTEFYNNIEKVRDWNHEFRKKNGRKRKSFILTYGCQMNEHDSEKMDWMLETMGYERANEESEADFVIFNTCAIRDNAEQKVYGKVGSFKTEKEKNPELKVALCGCMMQMENIRKNIEEHYSHVDIIFGTHNIHKLPELIAKNIKYKKMIVNVLEDSFEVVEGIDSNREHSFKGYVNITFGCDNFCTYCVVPYARGREISRKKEHIVREVENMAKNGCKEVMLLGQNVNSYGKTLVDKVSFPELLEEVSKVDGIKRLRFMTSHPKDISDELIEAYGKINNLSSHLHLPVQSGSNKILKDMNRIYTREEYLDKVKKIRAVRPDIALSTDIIVGFPGETEEDFQETLDLVKEVEYDFVYNFIYSKRPGTKAEKMDNHIDYETKHRRFERLNDLVNEIMTRKNKKYMGQVVEVLVEAISKTDEKMLSGRTDDFKLVHFPGCEDLIGKFVKVKINETSTFSIKGNLIK